MGVYPIAFASMIMGPPSSVTSSAFLGKAGVDEQTGILMPLDETLSIARTLDTIRAQMGLR